MSDMSTVYDKFEELWPKTIRRLERITGEEITGMAANPRMAYFHCKAVMDMYPDAAHLLAIGQAEDAMGEFERHGGNIEALTGGHTVHELPLSHQFKIARLFCPVARVLLRYKDKDE